uniref:Myeloid leukemia factor 1 n=1 Tax=Anthurium amnicola TaxID=1678845 RepID=A0A1D1YD52_9ARAE
MQRGRGDKDNFFGFGDPFANFGGFGRPGGLFSSFFGGRDPFDDPFFTEPFGGMMAPTIFGRNIFGAGGSPFGDPVHTGFLEDQAQRPKKAKGPIIQELTSDDEIEELGEEGEEKKDNSRKHPRSGKEPYVQEPDEEIGEKRSRRMQQKAEYKRANTSHPQNHSYSFQSSTVTYGGLNGAYHTSSTTRRTGGDGVTVEENREADTTTGIATHRISRGLRDKGHSVTRKLNTEGRVDTVQTLHNLNEDELTGFEEAWKGNARQHLPGWNQYMHNDGSRGDGSVQAGKIPRGWALPAAEQQQHAGPLGSEVHHPRRNFSNGRH